ncbi:MAG: sulfite exporter TauE/SafE family protein [Flavobacterium sp.]|jgi:hypothetical protein|nr:sulfite exporter TauE/SafE family protein [Flavobacterium sp.]
MEILGYLGALLIGLVLGLTGGGGSMLTVPILTYILLISPVTATAYSLFVVGTTSAFGAFQNAKKGMVDFKNGFLFAVPSFVAVFITRRFLVPEIPQVIISNPFVLKRDSFLMIFFGIIMLLAAFSMLKKKANVTENQKETSILSLVIQTFFIGIIIGLVGAGGGFLIIPSLVLFAKLPMKKAIGTSLFIIAINSLIGFMGDVQNLSIDWTFLLVFTGLSIIGIFIGMYLSKFTNENQLKKGFAYFVLAMALVIFYKEITAL